MIFALFFQKEI